MTELAVAAALSIEVPAISLKQADHLADFHSTILLVPCDSFDIRVPTIPRLKPGEQVKALLAVVVSEIRVEGKSSIQPFFVAPRVRTPTPERRLMGIELTHRVSTANRF